MLYEKVNAKFPILSLLLYQVYISLDFCCCCLGSKFYEKGEKLEEAIDSIRNYSRNSFFLKKNQYVTFQKAYNSVFQSPVFP